MDEKAIAFERALAEVINRFSMEGGSDSFPHRDLARRALGIADEPAPRSTAALRAALAEAPSDG